MTPAVVNIIALAGVLGIFALPLIATLHERWRWGGFPPADKP